MSSERPTYIEDVSFEKVARRRAELHTAGWRIVSSTNVNDAVLTTPRLLNGMTWYDFFIGSEVRLRYTRAEPENKPEIC